MKNLLSLSSFYQTEKGGRFLFQVPFKPKPIVSVDNNSNNTEKVSDLDKNKEKQQTTIKTGTEKELFKYSMEAESTKIPRKNNEAVGEKEKSYQEIVDEYFEETGKRYVLEDKNKRAELKKIEQKNYENNIDDLQLDLKEYVENPKGFGEYLKQAIPTDFENTGKIGMAGFALGAISHEGGLSDSVINGFKYGAIAAIATNPLITNALADGSRWVGKKIVFPAGKMGISIITDFIYSPGKFIDDIKNGKNPVADEVLGKKLAISQEPTYLRQNGMNFSAGVNEILDYMISNKNPEEIPVRISQISAKFMAQTESLANNMSPEALDEISTRIWNKDPNVSDRDIKKVIFMNLRKEIGGFFRGIPNIDDDYQVALTNERNNLELSEDDENKLNALGIDDLEGIIGVGNGNLAEITKEEKHGIQRALGNMSGSLLISYILMFLLSKGVMGMQGMFQPDTYTKENAKEKAKSVGKVLFFIPNELWEGAKKITGNSDSRKERKEVEKWGNSGKVDKKWNSDQQKAWAGLTKDEKNSVAEKLGKMVNEKDDNLQKKLEEIKGKYKDKKDKWWKLLKNRKITKEMKDDKDYKEIEKKIKGITKIYPKEWEGFFSGINSKAKEILFPKN